MLASSSQTDPSKFVMNTREYINFVRIGEGTYGVVYKALEVATNKYVAIKRMKLDTEESGVPPTSLRELAVLKEINHPNIVNLRSVLYQGKNCMQLVFEFVDYDLKKYMERSQNRLSPERIKSLLHQLLEGTNYCHSRRIIHRDLKPQNILVDLDGNLKIADFGLARCVGVPLRNYTHDVVTLWYRAPEVLLGIKTYGIGLDTWSIGCIFAEMVLHAPLFHGDAEIDQIFKIFQIMGTPNEESWPGVEELPDFKSHFPKWPKIGLGRVMKYLDANGVDLLEGFLLYSPGLRMTAKDALCHKYFADMVPVQEE